ncbi:MAG: SDR family NAD(P)-dependent oxidoreductase [Actinomycetota bacterium]|nr:SDR family NAD(P)-dependent oxidoreductase [Actinomycetota bacterium]
MKYLVTGAAGFIGSHLCHKLTTEGNEVIAIDNFSDYYDVNLKKLRVEKLLTPLQVKVLGVDISDKNAINELIASSKPEVVINLAAQAGVRLPTDQIHKYVNSNLVGFSNVLQSTVSNNIPYFLYASSSSVYGDQAAIPYTENEQKLHPNSFYGATKLANELLTPTLIKSSSTIARGLRFFTVYGPWGRPDMAYFRMIANVVSGSEFNFFGDGSVERDFTYIDDAVNSVLELTKELEKRKPGYSDVVNLGGGRPLSMNYLLENINKISKAEVKFNRQSSNSNDAKKTMSDSSYIQSLIGSKPETKLEDGINKTYQWIIQTDIADQLTNWVRSVQ